MLQKSLSYSIKKFLRFYRVQEKKNVILKKIKNYKIWGMDLSSDCFVKNFFIQYFDYLCKDSRRNWV